MSLCRAGELKRSRGVLEADLAAGDQLVVLGAAHLDLPELLGAALVDGGRYHIQATVLVGTQEVGDVVTPTACWSRSLTAS